MLNEISTGSAVVQATSFRHNGDFFVLELSRKPGIPLNYSVINMRKNSILM
jgi:hypothetical protein